MNELTMIKSNYTRNSQAIRYCALCRNSEEIESKTHLLCNNRVKCKISKQIMTTTFALNHYCKQFKN
jgi:hypothetical protein